MYYTMAVLDRDEVFLEETQNLVRQYNQANQDWFKVKEYRVYADLLADLKKQRYCDIYFIDVDLMDCKWEELIERIRAVSEALIVFVSSQYEYVLDGYEYEVFRYIPRNNIKSKLYSALNDASKKLLLQGKKYLVVNTPKFAERLCYDDIIYIYKDGKNSVFVLNTSEQRLKIRKILAIISDGISSEEFIFVDRCYIVNMRYIQCVNIYDSTLVLKTGEKLLISKRRIHEAAESIRSY